MLTRLNNRLTYLSASLVLLLAAVPLVSIGTNRGMPVLWRLGLAALAAGGLMPSAQRVFVRKPPSP